MYDKPTWVIGLGQTGHGETGGAIPLGLDNSSLDPGCITTVPRRTVRPYPQRQTTPRNGVPPHELSRVVGDYGAGVHRMRMRKGMVSEANAHGKAVGYADGGTATWKVEVPVAVHMP